MLRAPSLRLTGAPAPSSSFCRAHLSALAVADIYLLMEQNVFRGLNHGGARRFGSVIESHNALRKKRQKLSLCGETVKIKLVFGGSTIYGGRAGAVSQFLWYL